VNNQQQLNEGRKQRAAARRIEMQKLAAHGRTDKQIAAEVGVAEKTVRNNLAIARKDPFTITEDNRQATLDELMELKTEVKSHRKGNKPLPLAAVDRLIKIAEVVMRLEGTAAATKSITANVNVDQQAIPIEQQLEYLNAFAGLYEDERLQELDRVKARKRTCRVVMTADGWGQKALPESGS
jgi:predicted transcriptional regulator